MKGKFITFEGGDGAGKSTLIENIHSSLKEKGHDVVRTHAPGGSQVGQEIRKLLLHSPTPLNKRCELLLFLADRAQHVETVIIPALQEGKIVLCDRFNDSTIAYQGGARGLTTEEVKKLCDFSTGGLNPDLTLYLDLDPEIGLARVKQTGAEKDRIEAEDLDFHKKIRATFHEIAKHDPKRFHLIDASESKETVFENAMRIVYECCFRANA